MTTREKPSNSKIVFVPFLTPSSKGIVSGVLSEFNFDIEDVGNHLLIHSNAPESVMSEIRRVNIRIETKLRNLDDVNWLEKYSRYVHLSILNRVRQYTNKEDPKYIKAVCVLDESIKNVEKKINEINEFIDKIKNSDKKMLVNMYSDYFDEHIFDSLERKPVDKSITKAMFTSIFNEIERSSYGMFSKGELLPVLGLKSYSSLMAIMQRYQDKGRDPENIMNNSCDKWICEHNGEMDDSGLRRLCDSVQRIIDKNIPDFKISEIAKEEKREPDFTKIHDITSDIHNSLLWVTPEVFDWNSSQNRLTPHGLGESAYGLETTESGALSRIICSQYFKMMALIHSDEFTKTLESISKKENQISNYVGYVKKAAMVIPECEFTKNVINSYGLEK